MALPITSQPKPVVPGLNLLRSCRQVRREISYRVWNKPWNLRFPLLQESADAPFINLSYAVSLLNTEALARMASLSLTVTLDHQPFPIFGSISLRALSSFKGLRWLFIYLDLGSDPQTQPPTQVAAKIKEMPLLHGVMV